MKTCSKCQEQRQEDLFYKDKTKKDGLSSYCKVCQRQRSKSGYWKDRDVARAKNKIYYAANKEKYLAYGRALRERTLAEYGGRCTCCGETTPEFLGIDHIFNDGESHRRELGGYGRSIYRWLEQNGFPKDRFQLLCHNCNIAKGLYGGCPHNGSVPGRRQSTTRWTQSRTPAIGSIECG